MKNGLLHADRGSDTHSPCCMCTGVFQTLSSLLGKCMKGIRSGDHARPGGKPTLLAVTGRDAEELEDRHALQGFPGFWGLMPGCLSSARLWIPSWGQPWQSLCRGAWSVAGQNRREGGCCQAWLRGDAVLSASLDPIPFPLPVLLLVGTRTERTSLGDALAGACFLLPPSWVHPAPTHPCDRNAGPGCALWIPGQGRARSCLPRLRIYASLPVRGSSLWGPGSLMLM